MLRLYYFFVEKVREMKICGGADYRHFTDAGWQWAQNKHGCLFRCFFVVLPPQSWSCGYTGPHDHQVMKPFRASPALHPAWVACCKRLGLMCLTFISSLDIFISSSIYLWGRYPKTDKMSVICSCWPLFSSFFTATSFFLLQRKRILEPRRQILHNCFRNVWNFKHLPFTIFFCHSFHLS